MLKNKPENLHPPEYYMEVEGFDIRLAILKINDFLETLGDAYISLTYANPLEHQGASEKELIIIRRIHLRHAVIDLNNSFDLLLQVIWFYSRVWESFNPKGILHNINHNHNHGFDYSKKTPQLREIIRNTNNWVEQVEESCSLKKVLLYLKKEKESAISKLYSEFLGFKDSYIYNKEKKFTVKIIANQIKHKNSLKVKELNKPYDFNVSINSKEINIRKEGILINHEIGFFELNKPKTTIGKIDVKYKDDLYIDIEYYSGEKFRSKDFLKQDLVFSLDEIYDEAVNYTNSLINLYEELIIFMKPNIIINPIIENVKIKNSEVNLDGFFKLRE